jgi:nucleoside phosphorylase
LPKRNRSTDTGYRFEVETGEADVSMLVVQQEAMGKQAAYHAVADNLVEFDVGLVVCLGIAGSLSGAYSDEAGRGFRFEAGRRSEAKPATIPI